MMQAGGIDAKLKTSLPKSSPFEVKMLVEFVRHGISEGGDVQRFHLLEKLLAGIKQPEIGFSTKKLVAV